MSSRQEILIVLVIHEMSVGDSPAFRTLHHAARLQHTGHTWFVYDNSAHAQTVPDHGLQIVYHHDPSNPGVSHAYNQACRFAQEKEIRWMLFVDQDTEFPDTIFQQYEEAMLSFHDHMVFAPVLNDAKGIISPFIPLRTTGKRLKQITPGIAAIHTMYAINSGLLVSTALFDKAGGYNEQLKLDFTDFDFFSRLKLLVDSFIVVDAVCIHQHSSTQQPSLEKALLRFSIYVDAVAIVSQAQTRIPFIVRTLARAVRLSIRYRSTKFLGSFLFRMS